MMKALSIFLLAATTMASGCGESIKGINEDAKTAKAQAHEAVQAAQDAAARVDELSRAATDQAKAVPDGASEASH